MSEVEIEETCWGTVTLLVTIVIAFFSYRLFGPDQTVSEKPLKKVEQYEQEVKKPAKEEKLNESTASSEQSSSGPEFEIINSDDVPAVEEIQKMENEKPEETINENVQSQPEESVEPITSAEIEEPIKTEEAEPEAPVEEPKTADVVEDVKVAEVVEEIVTEPVQETEPEVVQEIVQADVQEAVQDAVEDIVVQEATPVEAEVPVAQNVESTEVIESKEIEPEVEKVDEIVEDGVKEPLVAAPVNTSNEEDEILDQLEKSILEADTTRELEVDEVRMENLEVSAHHTDNEEIDMDIVATGETLPDNAIIAEQEVEKSEKVDEEPNTDDFKETAAEIVDSVIDSLADFKKEHVSAAAGDELTPDEVVEEKNVQKKQLEEIQKLMEEKGMGEIDTTEQAKLYLD